MLGDLNAHSQALWGGKDTNSRGKKWEEFLERQGQLSVLNKGDKFTFVTNRGQSIIDVTMATPKVAGASNFWEVVDYVPASDHLAISFILHTGSGWTIPYKGWDIKNMSEEAIEGFRNDMESLSQPIPNSTLWWDYQDLNREANLWMSDTSGCLDQHAEKLNTRVNIRPLLWWDKRCHELSRKMKTIRNYLRKRKNAATKRGLPFTPFDPPVTHTRTILRRTKPTKNIVGKLSVGGGVAKSPTP